MNKTIFALATGNEIAALSVIRISGKECKKILKTSTLKSEPQDKVLVLRKFYNPQNKKEIARHKQGVQLTHTTRCAAGQGSVRCGHQG